MTRSDNPLARAFDALCRRAPAAPLVLDACRSWSVRDVDGLARALTSRLGESGLEPGRIVGLHLPDGPVFLAALVATLRCGGVALPMDRRASPAELDRCAERLGVAMLFTAETGWPGSSETVELARRPTSTFAPSTRRPTSVIKLTSGSTGEPRGIATSSEALLADEAALYTSMGLRPTDRLLAAVPFGHSYGLSSLVVPALTRGLPLVMPGAAELDPIDAAHHGGATVFPAVPAYLAVHVRRGAPRPLADSLRLVIAAGSPLPPPVAARFRRLHGRPIHVFYGASECGGITYDREGSCGERGTLGTPVDGVHVELVPVAPPEGGSRRVRVTSPAVGEAYWPEADTRLLSGTFLSEDLGDEGTGELRLIGRLGNLINTRGKKVNPREVEEVIARHGAVEDVCVVGESCSGSGDQRIRAVVACRPGSLTAEDIVVWCREHLSDFKIPRTIRLVDRLPTDSRGKLRRSELLRPQPGEPDRGQPRTSTSGRRAVGTSRPDRWPV